jgi:hypothetical protein
MGEEKLTLWTNMVERPEVLSKQRHWTMVGMLMWPELRLCWEIGDKETREMGLEQQTLQGLRC